MSKKVRCKDCVNAGCFAFPISIRECNYEYAKHVLETMKQKVYCKAIGKTKPMENEQYCKHYRKSHCAPQSEICIRHAEKILAEYEAELKGESSDEER